VDGRHAPPAPTQRVGGAARRGPGDDRGRHALALGSGPGREGAGDDLCPRVVSGHAADRHHPGEDVAVGDRAPADHDGTHPLVAEPDRDPRCDPEPDPEPDREPDRDSRAPASPDREADSDADGKAHREADAEADREAHAPANPEATPTFRPEADSPADPEADPASDPEADSPADPEADPRPTRRDAPSWSRRRPLRKPRRPRSAAPATFATAPHPLLYCRRRDRLAMSGLDEPARTSRFFSQVGLILLVTISAAPPRLLGREQLGAIPHPDLGRLLSPGSRWDGWRSCG